MLHLLIYLFLLWKTKPSSIFERQQAPNWWRDLLIEHVIQTTLTQSIPSRPHWGAQMDVIIIINPSLPKYIFSLPPNHTLTRPTASTHPGWLFPALLTVVYWYPQPAQQPHPTYLTPPSHLAPSAYQQPHLLTQRTLLLILTNPGIMAKVLFFGWWGIPSVDWSDGSGKSWVFIYKCSI